MRLPRRVPWASSAEVLQLYDYIFSPSADVASKERGLARMSVYLASPSCPAFLPLLHGLVTASILPEPSTGAEAMSKRMTCAMALVRFVNGMVDPLQTGGYARPISHLAATINLPPLLISVRHRATHDDLPPLPLLLTSVHLAIDYLHHFAFLPLLSSSSDTGMATISPSQAHAEHLVKRWKKVMKVRVGEKIVGEENPSGRELRTLRRELDALDAEDVVASLCSVGGLVPLARKKRPNMSTTTLAKSSFLIWVPLLDLLASSDPDLPSLLADQIVAALLAPMAITIGDAALETKKENDTFRWCLATWLFWLWEREDALAIKSDDKLSLARRVMAALLADDPVLRKVHRILASIDESLGQTSALNDLIARAEADDELMGLEVPEPAAVDPIARLEEMEARLRRLDSARRQNEATAPMGVSSAPSGHATIAPGWNIVGPSWKPCPIGVYV